MDQTPAAILPGRPGLPPGPYTVDEYERLGRDGLLCPEDRVELIEGGLVWKDAIGSPHASTVMGLTEYLVPTLAGRATVSIRNPVRLGHRSEPEPDVALLVPRPDRYRAGHPAAEDILLLMEVADTTLDYDRSVKGPLYARHGIVEYWIVNLEGNVVEVHRNPRPDGYRWCEPFGPDAVLTIDSLPGVLVPVREFLP